MLVYHRVTIKSHSIPTCCALSWPKKTANRKSPWQARDAGVAGLGSHKRCSPCWSRRPLRSPQRPTEPRIPWEFTKSCRKTMGWTVKLIGNYIGFYYNQLVGGIAAPLKNDGVRQLGWWHSQYMIWKNKINVPNHQPDLNNYSHDKWCL